MAAESSARDAALALRLLRRNPAFTATAILTLALGIGGNTAMFTVIRAVLLAPLRYADPDCLVHISIDIPRRNISNGTFSLAQFEEMRPAARSFSAMGVYLSSREDVNLSGGGDPEGLQAARVSANFLEILGIAPILGRSFRAEEDTPGGARVAMISESLWRRRLGGDRSAIGKTVTLDAVPHTIIGVLPAGFEFPFSGVDVWVTRPAEWSWIPHRYWREVTPQFGFARLAPGVTIDQARAELEVLNQQYLRTHPSDILELDRAIRIQRLADRLVSSVRPLLFTLLGAVGFVLLIACANVASLLLARASSRSREFAVRAALGASRGRLVRQLITESLILSLIGGAIGAVVANWSLAAVSPLLATSGAGRVNYLYLPRAAEIHVDWMVLGFTIALSLVTGVLFGLVPSLYASRPDVADALRATGVAARAASRGSRISARGLLVVGQVALSVVLLIGAALLIESFARLRSVDPGFRASGLLTMKISLPPARYDTGPQITTFFDDLIRRVDTIPGVRSAAMVTWLPTTSWIWSNIYLEGTPESEINKLTGAIQGVTPGYFSIMGIGVHRGREFTARDNIIGAPPVVILNENMAHRLWRDGRDPIGQRVRDGYDKALGSLEVIGVVADIRQGGFASKTSPEFYLPAALHPPPQSAYLVIRTAGEPMHFANPIRAQVLAIDPDQPVSEVRTMDAILENAICQRRLTMLLLGSFAAVALTLALIGIYGSLRPIRLLGWVGRWRLSP